MVKLKNPKTFAYTPKIGCIGETQLRLYTSYGQVYEQTTKRQSEQTRELPEEKFYSS